MIQISSSNIVSDFQMLLPASKSISNRLLIIEALCGDEGLIANLSEADDTRLLVAALKSNGEVIDVGAAGTAMRFLTAYYAVKTGRNVLLTGSERLQERPVGVLVDALRALGAQIEYESREGFPPLRIRGQRLIGGALRVNSGISSQFISALLLIAPILEHGLTLHLAGERVSQPYIEMTVELMQRCGAQVEWNREEGRLTVGHGGYVMPAMRVEADWSAASYGYEIAALAAKGTMVLMPDLNENSLQGDSRVARIFELLGVDTCYRADGVCVTNLGSCVPSLDFDFVEQPDLVQTVAVTCCLKGIPFRFSGVHNLALKETDRLTALKRELGKLGYCLQTQRDVIAWDGTLCDACEPATIATYKDHRMAMAFAPVCLTGKRVMIEDEGVVSKSFPRYWDELAKMGFVIRKL